jgi:hypothetical protein
MTRDPAVTGRFRGERLVLVCALVAVASLGCRRTLSQTDGPGTGVLPDASPDPSDAAPDAPGGDDATNRDGASDAGGCVRSVCATACGDCVDNDGDGLVDMEDSACTSPCDGTEDSFSDQPNLDALVPCRSDCAFDDNSGSGDDHCLGSHRCDPLEISPRFDPEGQACSYMPDAGDCAPQPDTCRAKCLPRTPNGCDCFGCCELLRGSGHYVWLNSLGTQGPSCNTLADVTDPNRCRPCTPVADCFNPCEGCERCVGSPDLPGGCATPACPAGMQSCGWPGASACPAGSYCLTGCCAPAAP